MEETTSRKVPESLRYRWILEIAQAIKYIHSEGIVHNDVKASKCFLHGALNVKVCIISSLFLSASN